jgi:hypothetical protein
VARDGLCGGARDEAEEAGPADEPMLLLPSMRLLSWVAVAAALVALTPPATERSAEGSVSVAIPFDTLVRASSAVVVATAEEQRAVWEEGRIFTYSRIHVETAIAGELHEDDEAWVKTMGGVVGKVGQIVDGEPVFTVGRPSLVFLHLKKNDQTNSARTATASTGLYLVTARAQGQFGLYTDEENRVRVRRSSAVGALVQRSPATTGDPKTVVLASDAIHGRPLDEATASIRAVWGPGPKPGE